VDQLVLELNQQRDQETGAKGTKRGAQRGRYGEKAREKAVVKLVPELKQLLQRGEDPLPPEVNATLTGNYKRKAKEDRERG
jgi:hypothetical protein